MSETAILVTFQLVVLIFSVMIHEISHGFVAERLGDSTARLAGRLTFNPLKHLDPFGSVILPLLLYFLTQGNVVFGWAKPVPYNPMNLKNPLWGGAKIAAAGPLSNFLLAFVFGILIKMFGGMDSGGPLTIFLGVIVYINILLAVFNLIPLPPLDGSKVLFALLPRSEGSYRAMQFLERYGFIILIFIIFSGLSWIFPIVQTLFRLFAG